MSSVPTQQRYIISQYIYNMKVHFIVGTPKEAEKEPMSERGAINKYKALLADLEKTEEAKKEDVAMEVTWDLKLEQKAAEKVKEISKVKETKTPFEQFLEKKKEKRKLKKEQKMAKSEGGEEAEDAEPFSDDEIPSDIDMNDPYFKEEIDKISGKKKEGKNKKKKNKEVSQNIEEDRQAKVFSVYRIFVTNYLGTYLFVASMLR